MKITGWIYTDATNTVDCPRCKEEAGKDCRMPSKRKSFTPHSERIKAYQNSISKEEFRKRHMKQFSSNILVQDLGIKVTPIKS